MDRSSVNGPRRIQLFSSGPLDNSKKLEKVVKSMRLTINLSEPTDSFCPEHSYVELLGKHKESKENLSDGASSAVDPFALQDEQEQEKLERIAQSFNEKYGGSSKKSKKRKKNIRDMVDLGEGYLEDSFVDNSEAYDEVVPWSLDTKHGGFYINAGKLDFVRDDDDDNDDGDNGDDNDDEDNDGEDSYDNDENNINDGDDEEAVNEDGEKEEKKKKSDNDDDNDELVMPAKKKKKMMLSSDNDEPVERSNSFNNDNNNNKNVNDDDMNNDNDGGKEKKKRMNKKRKITEGARCSKKPCISVNGKHRRESFNEKDSNIIINNNNNNYGYNNINNNCAGDNDNDHGDNGGADNDLCGGGGGNLRKLIAELLHEIDKEVTTLKEAKSAVTTATSTAASSPSSQLVNNQANKTTTSAAASSSSGHNVNLISLTAPLLEMLSRLYSLCQTRSIDERTEIFVGISQKFGISKEALFKKIKKYRISINNEKLTEAKSRLSEAISIVMPALLNKYKELLDVNQKLKLEQKEIIMMTSARDEAHHMTSGDDDDNNNNESDALNRSDSDKLKRIMAPRKKFPWTSEIRELLCDVVQLRLVHYNMSRIKSQTADEHIRQFLDAEVKNLWPPGWMQTRILYKESKVVHQRLTSADSSKAKKTLNVSATTSNESTAIKHQPMETTMASITSTQTSITASITTSPTMALIPAKNDPIVINLDDESNDDAGIVGVLSNQQTTTKTHNNSNNVATSKEQALYCTTTKSDQQQPKQQSQPAQQQHRPQHQKQHQIFQQLSQQNHQLRHKAVQPTPTPSETYAIFKDNVRTSDDGSSHKLDNFASNLTSLPTKTTTSSPTTNTTTTTTSMQMSNNLFHNISTSLEYSKSCMATQLKTSEIVLDSNLNQQRQHHQQQQQQQYKDSVVAIENISSASKKFHTKQVETSKNKQTPPQMNLIDHDKPMQSTQPQQQSDHAPPSSSSSSTSASKWIPSKISTPQLKQQQKPQQQQFQQQQQLQNIQHFSHVQQEIKSMPSRQQQPFNKKNADVAGDNKQLQQQFTSNYKPNSSWNAPTYSQNDSTGLTPQQQQILFQQKYQQYQQQQQERQQQITSKSPKQERATIRQSSSLTMTSTTTPLSATTTTTTAPRRVATTTLERNDHPNKPDDTPNYKTMQQHQQQFLSQSAQQRQQQQHIKQHQQTIENLEVVDKVMQQQQHSKQHMQHAGKQLSKSHSVEVQLISDSISNRSQQNPYSKSDHKLQTPPSSSVSSSSVTDNQPVKPFILNSLNIASSSSSSQQQNNISQQQQRSNFQQQQAFMQHNTPYNPHHQHK